MPSHSRLKCSRASVKGGQGGGQRPTTFLAQMLGAPVALRKGLKKSLWNKIGVI